MDETTGAIAIDSSGNGHHGTLVGGPGFSAGLLNNALQLNGANQSIGIDSKPAIVGTGAFTVAAWVKTTDGDGVIVQQRSINGFNGEYMLTVANVARFFVFGESVTSFDLRGTTPLNDGQWHHVAGVRESDGTGKLYVDGRLEASQAAVPRALISIEVYIGADRRDNSSYLTGLVDDVRIYDYAAMPVVLASFPAFAPAGRSDDYHIAVNQTLQVAAPGVLANDFDFNQDPLTAELVDPPGSGALTFNPDGSFEYVAGANAGTVTFTYKAKDAALYSSVTLVTLHVNPAPTLTAIAPERGVTGRTLHNVTLTGSNFPVAIPTGAVAYNGHYYLLINQAKTWAQAKTHCEGLGGHLVTITSPAENSFIMSINGGQSTWIGLTDESVEGAHVWITGEGSLYRNWLGGQPDNAGNEDYVELYSTGAWNDLPSGEVRKFVCEFDNHAPPEIRLIKAGETDIVATNVTVRDITHVACTLNLTGAAIGDYDVKLTNPDQGSATLAEAFTIAEPPVLLAIDPDEGDQGSSTTVTITGEHLPPFQGDVSAARVLTFDGSNDYVRIASSDLINSPNITMEAWVKGGFQVHKRNAHGWVWEQFHLSVGAGGPVNFWVANAGRRNICTSNTLLPATEWTHVACSFDGTNQRIYINGVLDAELAVAWPIQSWTEDMYLYREPHWGNTYTAGSMSEFRFWKVARTQAQIAGIMNEALTAGHADLVMRYDFSGTGPNLTDTSGNGHTGFTSGGPIFGAYRIATPVSVRLKKDGTSIFGGEFTGGDMAYCVRFNLTGMPGGLYDLELLEDGVVTATLPQCFTVVIPPGLAVALPESEPLKYQGAVGGGNPAGKVLQITNVGTQTLNWTASSNAAWLTLTPDSGSTTTETDTCTANVNLAGLTIAGSPYTATITVNAPGAQFAPKTIAVRLVVTANGLVAHWKLDETSGISAADVSGSGYTGTLQNGPVWSAGVLNNGLQFDGSNDHVTTTYQQQLPQWTIAHWVKSPAPPSNLTTTGPLYFGNNFQINWNHGDSRFMGAAAVRIGGGWHAASFGALEANTWYHFAASYDGQTLRAYRDGVLVSENTAPAGNADNEPNPLTLGKNLATGVHFAGTIDDVRVYNRMLSATEIAVLGGGVITDLAGNALDGEFGGSFNSGNGTPGGDFAANFTLSTPRLRVTEINLAQNVLLPAGPQNILARFSKNVLPSSLNGYNCRLWRAGADGALGTGDDVRIAPVAITTPAADQAAFDLSGAALPPDRYRLELSGTPYARSLAFNNQILSVPNNLIRGNNTLTLSAWFNTSAGGVILGYQNQRYPTNPSQTVPVLYVGTDGKLRGQVWHGGVTPITSATAVNDGKWHHVVLVATTNVQTLYLDGQSVGMRSGAVNHLEMSFNQIGIGYSSGWPGAAGGWNAFNGRIDEVSFWNVALTPAQAANLSQRKLPAPAAGVLASYMLDEGSGQIVTDSSGNQSHGTLGLDATVAIDDPTWSATAAPLVNVITDLSGNALDGDDNGAAGGTFQLNFRIQTPPVASNSAVVTAEEAPVFGTLAATGSPDVTLTYSLVTQGAKGTVELAPGSNSFVYRPHVNENGLDSFTFKVTDGSFESNLATVTVSITPVNDAPELASEPTAAPNPAFAGKPVVFAALGHDIDGDALTYAWDFADGGSGSGTNPTHVFAAAGTYQVRVTVSDSAGASASASAAITIIAVGGGTGGGAGGGAVNLADTDSDGISDADELLLDTDPLEANSPAAKDIEELKLTAQLKFDDDNKDALMVSGLLPKVPAGFAFKDAVFELYVGGVKTAFKLDAKGKAKNKQGMAQLKGKTTRTNASFSVKLKAGDWADDWEYMGIDPDADAVDEALIVTVIVRLNDQYFRGDVETQYSAKGGKNGKIRTESQ